MSNLIWAIADIKKTSTQHHSGFIYKITLLNYNGDVAITYADPTNHNYKNWDAIIERHNQGFGVCIENCNISNRASKGDTLINADSKPTIFHETDTHEELMDILDEIINDDPRERLLKSLFEF